MIDLSDLRQRCFHLLDNGSLEEKYKAAVLMISMAAIGVNKPQPGEIERLIDKYAFKYRLKKKELTTMMEQAAMRNYIPWSEG